MEVAAITTNNITTTTAAADDVAIATNAITTSAADSAATASEVITTAADEDGAAKKTDDMKKNIQVSNNRRPLLFYLNLAKRYIKQQHIVELSGLGMAIPTVILIAEILKTDGLAIATRTSTSSVGTSDEAKGYVVQKAKIEVELAKLESGSIDSETI